MSEKTDAVFRTLLTLVSEYVAEDSAQQLPSGSGKGGIAEAIAESRGWERSSPKVESKTFEVIFRSVTYRSYEVVAPDAEAAEQVADSELVADETVSSAWTQNAEITAVTEVSDER